MICEKAMANMAADNVSWAVVDDAPKVDCMAGKAGRNICVDVAPRVEMATKTASTVKVPFCPDLTVRLVIFDPCFRVHVLPPLIWLDLGMSEVSLWREVMEG